MKTSYRTIFLLPLLAGLANSCSQPGISTDAAIFQGFDLQNNGTHAVTDVKIIYGDYVFPDGFQSPIVGVPKFKGMSGFHQTASVPVPQTAKIHWKSFDNQPHDVEIPIRSLITDWTSFHGFKFAFLDDHVELSVTNYHDKPAPYGFLDYTKVYSSIGGVIPSTKP